MADHTPSDAQLEILQVLWESSPQTVREIHEELQQQREVGYTTVLKQIQRMTDKGLVQAEKLGKSYTYTPLIRENQVRKTLLTRLKDTVFRGSAMDLALHALGQESTPSQEELAQLQAWLQQQTESRDQGTENQD
ncbi:MAG: BlaI/MecI/CopY family transcriptional regulator [Bacteroidota bacterium]